ncbi:TatD family hydrolase [Caldimonas tepidiphila]|uniref:TatD family hydrolase n=1 Tax=Caldimonas tepidiphila TaxID=2315841 RepID=UPI000E5B70A2|nr:TatD family hydrolase [Caldimonas tepidiphila]
MWIDTHCHLDAPEFDADRTAVVQRAKAAGVHRIVVPAVLPDGFGATRAAAHLCEGAYALGTHPLYVVQAGEDAAARLALELDAAHEDERLVAVGEIGLDFFVSGLDRERQQALLVEQLKLARAHDLPVLLHVRRSVDAVLAALRRVRVPGGIAHAFNGSMQQARAFIELGFKLGLGGAMTFERALQIRRLAADLPAEAIVLETDAPDIPPQWLYRTAGERAAGQGSRNEPSELPRIAQTLAALRGWTLPETAERTADNARAALPGLAR